MVQNYAHGINSYHTVHDVILSIRIDFSDGHVLLKWFLIYFTREHTFGHEKCFRSLYVFAFQTLTCILDGYEMF